MPTAADIITYIGVPLAVLGVLPILYTAINSLFTIRSIQRKLRANGFADIKTRGSLMSGIVEVSLPRYSITPLNRDEDAEAYWGLNPFTTTVKGGTWTVLNWQCLKTGSRLYRLQYSDELQIPQAEINFENLFIFLLDRGAVPDVKGLRMLRLSGLWTPTGTSLLLSPSTTESVLRVALPDDSDGILSLSLQWKEAWDKRDPKLLPPGWMRLQISESLGEVHLALDKAPLADPRLVALEKKPPLVKPTSLRFRLGQLDSSTPIADAVWEHENLQLDLEPSLEHLQSIPSSKWVASIAIGLALSKSTPLYSHTLDPVHCDLSKRDSMPCGVLVMLGILDENDAPPWETKYDPFEKVNRLHSSSMAQQRAIRAEGLMSQEQSSIARKTRLEAERQQMTEDFRADLQRNNDRAAKRRREAITSPRLANGTVAKAALAWLVARQHVEKEATLECVVEQMLLGVIQNDAQCMRVLEILGKWRQWSDRGGMTVADLEDLQRDVFVVCKAACVMGLLKDVSAKDQSPVALDMRECIQHWKKVRLG